MSHQFEQLPPAPLSGMMTAPPLEVGRVFAAPGGARVLSRSVHRDVTKRSFDPDDLARVYDELVIDGVFQERGDYYVRYRNRYESLISTYAALGGMEPLDVLEVGGGQHALLAHALFADRATVADLSGPHLDYLSSHGITTVHWDLLTDEQPFRDAFDRIFLCEVMAHLPVPPYQYLGRLRLALRPGGALLVSTPNLHRVRNIALLLAGKEPFGPFRCLRTRDVAGQLLGLLGVPPPVAARAGRIRRCDHRTARVRSPRVVTAGPPRQPRVATAHAHPLPAVQPRRHRHQAPNGVTGLRAEPLLPKFGFLAEVRFR